MQKMRLPPIILVMPHRSVERNIEKITEIRHLRRKIARTLRDQGRHMLVMEFGPGDQYEHPETEVHIFSQLGVFRDIGGLELYHSLIRHDDRN